MEHTIFTFSGVWKFKYTNSHGVEDCMITLDRNRAEEWAGRRDGILVQLYEVMEKENITSNNKPICQEVKERCLD